MEKFFNRLIILSFLIIIFGCSYKTFFAENVEDKSFYENRYLEKPLPLTFKNYVSGDYIKTNEKAFSDHIFMRDDILKLYTSLNYNVLHKKEVNKIVFGDGVLLPYYRSNGFDKAQTDEEITKMSDDMARLNEVVKQNGGQFVFAAIPAQFSLYGDKFPPYVCNFSPKLDYVRQNFTAALTQRNVPFIDMKTVYSAMPDKDKLYFATDHHFTCYGALEAYRQIMRHINDVSGLDLKILGDDELEFKTIPNDFLGSQSRKIYDIYPHNDKLTICYPKQPVVFERFDDGNKVAAELFKLPVAGKYADYESFMGIDRPEVIIDTHRPELPSVLIFGDSYTNAVETLLYYGFNKVYSLDCRYYKAKTVAEYIAEKKPDFVVYVRDDTIYLSRENNGDFFGEYEEEEK